MYSVKLTKTAKKDLKGVDKRYKRRITVALVSLQRDPESGKKLAGKLKRYRTLRVWPYRILYRIEKREALVYVIPIGHRQGVYKQK